jgi:hypothetical protein
VITGGVAGVDLGEVHPVVAHDGERAIIVIGAYNIRRTYPGHGPVAIGLLPIGIPCVGMRYHVHVRCCECMASLGTGRRTNWG